MDSGETLVRDLVARFAELDPIYSEHLSDNQGLLPHVIFWDFTQAAVNSYLGREPHLDWLSLVRELDARYKHGDACVRGIIEVSFLENLPYANEEGFAIVDELPYSLLKAFNRVRPKG